MLTPGKPKAKPIEVLYEAILKETRTGKLRFRCGRTWTLPVLRKGVSRLCCDYDGAKSVLCGEIVSRLSRCKVRVLRITKRRSPGGFGFHIVIVVEGNYNRFQCTALQAICESDPEREAANFRRALAAKSDAEWRKFNVLFTESKRSPKR